MRRTPLTRLLLLAARQMGTATSMLRNWSGSSRRSSRWQLTSRSWSRTLTRTAQARLNMMSSANSSQAAIELYTIKQLQALTYVHRRDSYCPYDRLWLEQRWPSQSFAIYLLTDRLVIWRKAREVGWRATTTSIYISEFYIRCLS
jgi:hypothetical protein